MHFKESNTYNNSDRENCLKCGLNVFECICDDEIMNGARAGEKKTKFSDIG